MADHDYRIIAIQLLLSTGVAATPVLDYAAGFAIMALAAPSSSLAQDIWFSARRLGFKSPWGYAAGCERGGVLPVESVLIERLLT